MLTQQLAEQSYRRYIGCAVEYFYRYGNRDTLYNHFEGVAHGIGETLEYEYDRVKDDIAAAIETAKDGADNE